MGQLFLKKGNPKGVLEGLDVIIVPKFYRAVTKRAKLSDSSYVVHQGRNHKELSPSSRAWRTAQLPTPGAPQAEALSWALRGFLH